MTYVPIVVTPPPPPSPRTRELAGLLSRVIEEYEKHHPAVTGPEVREALSLAAQSSKGASAQARSVVAVLLLGLLAFGATAFYALRSAAGGADVPLSMITVVIGVIIVLGLVAVLRQKGSM